MKLAACQTVASAFMGRTRSNAHQAGAAVICHRVKRFIIWFGSTELSSPPFVRLLRLQLAPRITLDNTRGASARSGYISTRYCKFGSPDSWFLPRYTWVRLGSRWKCGSGPAKQADPAPTRARSFSVGLRRGNTRVELCPDRALIAGSESIPSPLRNKPTCCLSFCRKNAQFTQRALPGSSFSHTLSA